MKLLISLILIALTACKATPEIVENNAIFTGQSQMVRLFWYVDPAPDFDHIAHYSRGSMRVTYWGEGKEGRRLLDEQIEPAVTYTKFVWLQGSHDSFTAGQAEAYKERLRDVIAYYKAAHPSLQFYLAPIPYPSDLRPYNYLVIQAQRELAEEYSFVHFVEVGELEREPDRIHITKDSAQVLYSRILEVMKL